MWKSYLSFFDGTTPTAEAFFLIIWRRFRSPDDPLRELEEEPETRGLLNTWYTRVSSEKHVVLRLEKADFDEELDLGVPPPTDEPPLLEDEEEPPPPALNRDKSDLLGEARDPEADEPKGTPTLGEAFSTFRPLAALAIATDDGELRI